MEMKFTGFLVDEDDVLKWLQECWEKIIEHMNVDHRNSLSESMNASYEIQDKETKMVIRFMVTILNQKNTYSQYHSGEVVILARNTTWD